MPRTLISVDTSERLLGLTSLHTRNLWMCWKSRRWWAQHARHFHLYEATGNQLRPFPLLTQSILKVSESVTRSKVSDQCSSRRPTAPARNSGRYWSHLTPANLRSWNLICSFLSLSLSLLRIWFMCALFWWPQVWFMCGKKRTGLVTTPGSEFLKGVKTDSLFLEEYFLSKQNVKHPYLINLEFRSTQSDIRNKFAERFKYNVPPNILGELCIHVLVGRSIHIHHMLLFSKQGLKDTYERSCEIRSLKNWTRQ